MTKIRVRSGRGTGTIEVDSDASKWSGEDFKKIQAAFLFRLNKDKNYGKDKLSYQGGEYERT